MDRVGVGGAAVSVPDYPFLWKQKGDAGVRSCNCETQECCDAQSHGLKTSTTKKSTNCVQSNIRNAEQSRAKNICQNPMGFTCNQFTMGRIDGRLMSLVTRDTVWFRFFAFMLQHVWHHTYAQHNPTFAVFKRAMPGTMVI